MRARKRTDLLLTFIHRRRRHAAAVLDDALLVPPALGRGEDRLAHVGAVLRLAQDEALVLAERGVCLEEALELALERHAEGVGPRAAGVLAARRGLGRQRCRVGARLRTGDREGAFEGGLGARLGGVPGRGEAPGPADA